MLDLRLALPDDHLAVGDRPIKITCPDRIHKERTGKTDKERSLAVYPDHLQCYGCGLIKGGTGGLVKRPFAWQLEALALLLNITPEQARAAAPKYDSEALDAYRERAAEEARRDPLPKALAAAYHQLLFAGPREHRLAWLYARGLDDMSIYDFQLGHDGFRFVIPVFSASGDLLTLRYRRDDEYGTKRVKYCGMSGRNGFYLYPEDRLRPDLTQVVICEGELDAVRCWQEGWPAVSATNGAGQVPKVIAALQELLPGLQTVVLATDQDEPGEEAAYVAGELAEAAGLTVSRWRWSGAKDITEALQLGAELREVDWRDCRAPVPAGHAA